MVEQQQQYGCAILELNMKAIEHRINVKKGTKVIAVKSVTIMSPIVGVRPIAPEEKVFIFTHVPVNVPPEPDVVIVRYSIVGEHLAAPGKYLDTIGFQGKFLNFYIDEDLSGAIEV